MKTFKLIVDTLLIAGYTALIVGVILSGHLMLIIEVL